MGHRSCAFLSPPCPAGRVSPQPLSVLAQPSQLMLLVLFRPVELLPVTRDVSDSAARDQFPSSGRYLSSIFAVTAKEILVTPGTNPRRASVQLKPVPVSCHHVVVIQLCNQNSTYVRVGQCFLKIYLTTRIEIRNAIRVVKALYAPICPCERRNLGRG